MKANGAERRRAPRVQAPREHRLSLDMSVPVQVVDISRSGVLLASKAELTVGDRAQLSATIGQSAVRVAIEIRHVSVDTSARGGRIRYRAGAVFAPMSAEQRVILDQLLGAE
jgi:hypothetical protein